MPTVTTTELGRMQAQAQSMLLVDRCTIKRVTLVDDPYGGQASSEVDFATLVPCSVEQPSGRETIAADKVSDIETFTVLFPTTTDIRVGDIIVITTKGNERMRIEAHLAPETFDLVRHTLASHVE